MLNRSRLPLLLSGVTLGGTLIAAGPAAADPTPRPTGGVEQCRYEICVGVGTGGGQGGGGGTSGGTTGGSSGGKVTCEIGGLEVPCQHHIWGTFSNGCYYKLADPQPVADAEVWDGHKPGDGAIYEKSCPPASIANGAAGPIVQGLIWLSDAPGAEQADPAVLAQQAMDKMTLRGPDIGIAPRPGRTGVIGMPVWMWTEVGAETWGPNRASASVPGLTVTATARAEKIVWQMGDGTSVTCTSAGTPYQQAYGRKKSPDCGHTYRTTSARLKGGKFAITATTTWNVHWEGGGQSGDLTATRSSRTSARIGEVQVVGD
ncbi:ATP/GTP-binding protein [Streptomyces sp. OfavH-34-F]|uniref:ATP/GTP-binding protein n=1 Tax=Streptomyces sp. OfavH-34-F TaxID=2917760 RepID=UPI001EF1CAFF|nr:ATP/GTP-binding protein [Streptomyces sp. OfavH-34-F]MCG7524562.1 ATP/GTP-binding protein [Streptomyces sp. OfavH-34-F]